MSKPDRKLRVGVTISIREGAQSVWENGIFQNCILLVQMFKQMPEVGDAVLVHGAGVKEIPAGLMLAETGTQAIGLDQAMETLDVVIEMSDQLSEDWVEKFRAKGGRFAAMKVGNEYFIDAERAIYKLPHAGLFGRKSYDAIWTLPQYGHCCADYFSLNTRAPVRIVPHLWSPVFLEMGLSTLPAGVRFGYQGGRNHWRVCVFEPNLCMVKTSIIPMLVCEEAYRQKPPFAEIFRFCNTYKSKDNQSFVRFAQSLDIVKNGLSSFDNRFHYYEFMAHHGDCVVSHQWHNAQNYLYYETLHGGYPLVHNSPILRDVGYYYPDFDCRAGGEALVHAHETHDTSLEEYKARASGFLETLGIAYTPNIEAYRSALLGLFTPNSSSLPEQILQVGGESAAQPVPAAAETELAADESGLTKTEGRHGTFFIAKSDSYVGRSLELYGEWAEAEVFLFSQIVKEGDIVVEAGANIGAHTIPLSRMCGSGIVHAFEPQPFVFSLLQRNAAVNTRRNVMIWNSALGAASGRAPMPLLHPDGENPVNFGAASLHDTHPVRSDGTPWGKVPVSVMAIDDIEDIPRFDFLKTDAEGFDFQVLQGAIGKIRRCRPAIFVESISHHGDITDAVNSLLGELGYSTWHFNTHLFNPDNHKKSTHNIFARMASFDVLCLPAEKFKVERLESALRPVPVLPTREFPDDYWRRAKVTALR